MSIDRLQPISPAALAARTSGPGIPASRTARLTDGAPLASMSADAFRGALQRGVARDALPAVAAAAAAEAERRLAHGWLEVPDLRVLLLETSDSEAWATVRRTALTTVTASPELAPSIISMHAQLLRLPAATVREGQDAGSQDAFHAQATLILDDRQVSGSIQRARTRKGARQQAMTTLIAAIAALPDPLADRAVEAWGESLGPAVPPPAPMPGTGSAPAQGRSPISVLHEFAQAGHTTKPDFRVTGAASAFTATVTAVHRGQKLTAKGEGTSKQSARAAAADGLLELLQEALAADLAPAPAPEPPAAPAGPPPPALLPPTGLAHTQEPPRTLPASAAELFRANQVLEQEVADGAALTLLPARHPAHSTWMVFRPDGAPLPDLELPAPLQPVTRDLVLAGASGIMPRRATVTGMAVPLGLALPLLLDPRESEHASVTGWRHPLRLALTCVAQQRVHPALTDQGQGCWRIGPITKALRTAVTEAAAMMAPEGHCLLAGTNPIRVPSPEHAVWPLLDAVADTMLRTPGTATLLGPGPHTGPAGQDADATTELWRWADEIEDTVDPHPTPRLVLRIKEPDTDGSVPTAPAALHLAAGGQDDTVAAITVWDGQRPHAKLTPATLPAVRRALRRAARHYPPLAHLAAQERPHRLSLTAEDLARLHDHATAPLAEAGITVQWPPALLGALTATAVIGNHDPYEDESPTDSGYLALKRLVDCRWHINLDGDPLTEQEMTALAEAAWPLIRLRGRWLFVDADTARRARVRDLAPLPSLDALAAALSGTLTLDGEALEARPAGALATLVGTLRGAPDDPRPVPPPAALKATLRHYQQRALTWLANMVDLGFGALLADDMGLGKTLTTIALHLNRAETGGPTGPTLVVCPASLIANWEREIARFAPSTTIVRYHGVGRTLDRGALDHNTAVITTYGTVRRDTAALAAAEWGLVVADEAQHIKNPTSATAKALRAVPARGRIAVTGTPVENNITELWAILDWTNPGLFGTRKAFRTRYGAVEKDSASPAAAQLARLVGPFMLRRRKTDPGIAPELPGKVHHHRIVALTAEQIGLYEASVRDTMDKIATSTGIQRRGLVLKLLQALRQICNTPSLYLKEPLEDADPAGLARRSGKLTALDDLMPTLAERGEAALIFTGYVQMGRILEHHLRARGRSVRFLHGGTPQARRQDLVDAFQNDPDPAPVFILSVKAAGTGLTLTRAEHVVHYDRPWNPAVEDQATDRAHRIGQHRTVQIHHLITEGTVEDHINDLLARKRALTDAVLTSGESALADLDDTELSALVALGTR
ncbi:SNF2-related protein [Streptomyces sp. NBC_01221]|uniref:SNF2-related protein n=1 Tax=Streptomyces sp. NBC_01221 TaxID=2903782 RepID=UPI00225BAF7E|nr:SNF2-related protein [Streptomyces sp. NBC_01221]MCX4791897.1 SNF2-related protein [Streptomyces sp. NBC_01221]